MDAEYVWLGHDNTIDLILKTDGTATDLASVTKITATFDDTLISNTSASSGTITWSGYDTGEIRLALGGATITAGSYKVPIVVYDPANATGVVWGNPIPIVVKAEVEATP